MTRRLALTAVLALTAIAFAAPAAHAAAPLPPHVWTAPSGHVRGVVLTIHGGGWTSSGAEYLATEDADAARYRALGWATLNVDYRPGVKSVVDVARMYDVARRRVGAHVPICSSGESAGGHLAMYLATMRPALACAISQQGPAALMPLLQGYTVPQLYAGMHSVFTVADADRLSIGTRLDGYRGRVLATYSYADTVIPGRAQAAALAAIDANVTALRVHGAPAFTPTGQTAAPTPAGARGFVHMNHASERDLAAFYAAERDLLNRVGA